MDFVRDYDVVVAGAGVAGVAAAIECARSGLRTALVEKTILTGGLATSGIVNIYLPLCDGNGRQVLFGLAEELLHASIRYGPGNVPTDWRTSRTSRYCVAFAPAAFALALDELLVEAGVSLWLDTLVSAPVAEGERVTGIEVENKSGRGLLRAQCVIDATGDADVAFRMGCPCVEAGNWLSLWALRARLESAQKAVAAADGRALLDVIRLGADDSGQGARGGRDWWGTDGKSVSEFILASRKMLLDHYKGGRDRHDEFPLCLPTMAQFRTTRRIEGQTTMRDGEHGRHVPASVGLAPDWRQAGRVCEVPYGALLPRHARGLLAVGRCMAAEGDAWQTMRVIPPAVQTGQAAGIAATLAVKHDTPTDAVAAADIQAEMRKRGMPVHLADVGL